MLTAVQSSTLSCGELAHSEYAPVLCVLEVLKNAMCALLAAA
jgi:hypothetical protein